MAQPVFQKSFNSGEWAPQLYSRVDIERYHSGAALMENWFVDYRGGASTRPGTRYILQAYKSSTAVRLIPFQASFSVSYILEFGNEYIRFYNNGAPVLEATDNITGITQANPCVVSVINSYNVGDWVYISSVGGMTQLNGNYYSISAASGSQITLADLNGNPINSTTYSAYTAGGTTARVYTLSTPYAAADLQNLQYAQSVNQLILTHPNYQPQELVIVSASQWTLTTIDFGTNATAPTGVHVNTTLSSGSVNYSYVVTSISSDGEESYASTAASLTSKEDLSTTPGSNSISWTAVSNSVATNVYKSDVSYFGVIPAGVPYGFIGQVTGNTFIDTNAAPDFSQTPPIGANPFNTTGIASITQTAAGTYTSVPSVAFNGGNPNSNAIAAATLGVTGTPTVGSGGTNYAANDYITLADGVIVQVNTISGSAVATLKAISASGCSPGSITIGATPSNPVAQVGTTGSGTGATINLVWGVISTTLVSSGAGYQSTPTISYNPTGATATAALGTTTLANPSVPSFYQQRLVLAAAIDSPGGINFSQPGAYYNFDISNPAEPDDAISETLASGVLETIQAFVATGAGLVTFTDKSSWLINGGSLGSAISPSSIVANRQSFNGSANIPPILNNYDILYVESKGSSVRDATYNYYAQVFTGTDISVIASHLFFGYKLLQWAWAYSPFRLVWAIRNDGILLCLTFSKEEDFIAWTHHETAGLFNSIATVVESTATEEIIDAVYFVVERVINGNTVQYIERLAERAFPSGATSAWCIDAGIQYNGVPQTIFSGAGHLAGATVTGLADGEVIPPFIMPLNGIFTLSTAASVVTIGLGYNCDLQTLPIDTGEPTIQSKVKKVPAVTLRCVDTLGLSIGSTFNSLVAMQDLVVGNVGSMLIGQPSQVVSGLFTGDARTILDPTYTVPGQYCIRQALPLPATITGVLPQLTVGDTTK